MAHIETKQRYSVERLHAHLRAQGRHKRLKVTTNSNHNKLIYPNLLDQKFDTYSPKEAWVSDITYIWMLEGWLYLAGVKDLYTKEIVGYAINKSMTADLVCRALNIAIEHKLLAKGLIFHSDRGSQYCSNDYHKIIKQHKLKGSMFRRGNCFDNAHIESFLSYAEETVQVNLVN